MRVILKRNVFRLAKIHEKDGKTEEAAKIMQELQVFFQSALLVVHSWTFDRSNDQLRRSSQCYGSGGDIWVNGETREGGVDPGADETVPPHPRLHQVSPGC